MLKEVEVKIRWLRTEPAEVWGIMEVMVVDAEEKMRCGKVKIGVRMQWDPQVSAAGGCH